MVAPRALVFRPLVKEKETGNDIALGPLPMVPTTSNNSENAWFYLAHLTLHDFFFTPSSILDP